MSFKIVSKGTFVDLEVFCDGKKLGAVNSIALRMDTKNPVMRGEIGFTVGEGTIDVDLDNMVIDLGGSRFRLTRLEEDREVEEGD